MGDMTHPLRTWLKANKMNVKSFCEGAPFSYVTVYRLLKGEGDFSTSTLRAISDQTGGAVTSAQLIERLTEPRSEAA